MRLANLRSVDGLVRGVIDPLPEAVGQPTFVDGLVRGLIDLLPEQVGQPALCRRVISGVDRSVAGGRWPTCSS